jgi:hypothetical protein
MIQSDGFAIHSHKVWRPRERSCDNEASKTAAQSGAATNSESTYHTLCHKYKTRNGPTGQTECHWLVQRALVAGLRSWVLTWVILWLVLWLATAIRDVDASDDRSIDIFINALIVDIVEKFDMLSSGVQSSAFWHPAQRSLNNSSPASYGWIMEHSFSLRTRRWKQRHGRFFPICWPISKAPRR